MPATKVKSDWVDGNLVFSEKVAANGGQVIFGGTNGGVDVVFRGTTSGIYSMWDESANAWVNKDINLELGDSDYLIFGDSTDASLGWDSAKLALTAATASTFQLGTSTANINTRFVGTLTVGSTGKSLGNNVTFYGTTAVNNMVWTAASNELILDGTDIRLNDSDYLKLGDSTDASLCWDSAKIALTAATASAFQVGSSLANVNTRFVGTVIVGTTGLNAGKDVTLFGTTTANYVKLTAASNLLSLINVNMLLGDGEYIRGTSTASNSFSLNAWSTAVKKAIEVKNSTGDAAIKLGFFSKTPAIQVATIAASTTDIASNTSKINAILVGLKGLGLFST